MSKALKLINPLEDNLSTIDTKGLKILYRRFKPFNRAWRPQDTILDNIYFDGIDEEIVFVNACIVALKEELDKREHISIYKRKKRS